MSVTSDSVARRAGRILLVEDDRELSRMLAEVLAEEGYDVDVAFDGQRGLHLGLTGHHDAMVVDRGLPAVEGVDLIRRLRKQGVVTPMLVLSALGTVSDRIEGLDAGAEDYMVKPFDLDELLARIRALLRRQNDDAEILRIGAAQLVLSQRVVIRENEDVVTLSQRECAFLELLARRPSQVFTRDDLLDRVFGGADTPGAVDTYVHYLRRKLGRRVITTVRGSGYRLGSA